MQHATVPIVSMARSNVLEAISLFFRIDESSNRVKFGNADKIDCAGITRNVLHR